MVTEDDLRSRKERKHASKKTWFRIKWLFAHCRIKGCHDATYHDDVDDGSSVAGNVLRKTWSLDSSDEYISGSASLNTTDRQETRIHTETREGPTNDGVLEAFDSPRARCDQVMCGMIDPVRREKGESEGCEEKETKQTSFRKKDISRNSDFSQEKRTRKEQQTPTHYLCGLPIFCFTNCDICTTNSKGRKVNFDEHVEEFGTPTNKSPKRKNNDESKNWGKRDDFNEHTAKRGHNRREKKIKEHGWQLRSKFIARFRKKRQKVLSHSESFQSVAGSSNGQESSVDTNGSYTVTVNEEDPENPHVLIGLDSKQLKQMKRP